MINTNELRRNNIVAVKGGFQMFVKSIFEDEVHLDFDGNEGDVWEEKEEDIFGVPLTEKIIGDLGFATAENYYWKNWGTNGVMILKYDDVYGKFKIELGKSHYRVLDYIHELQNGFMFLTCGKELTYTPSK